MRSQQLIKPKQMKIKFHLDFKNIGLVLTVLFVAFIVVELYFAYTYLYQNLRIDDDAIVTSNIVRVNLEDYKKTIELLDGYEQYQPPPLFLIRPNPFE